MRTKFTEFKPFSLVPIAKNRQQISAPFDNLPKSIKFIYLLVHVAMSKGV
jgi:hypothetical protein